MAWHDSLIGGGAASGSGIGSMFKSFMHPEAGYGVAEKPWQQGWDQAQKFQQPFQQNGVNQIAPLNTAENNLLNPTQLQNQWSQSYEMSPYAVNMQKQAKDAGLDAASSQGLLGSSTSLNNIQQGASNIMQKDRKQYMDDLMQKYMTGIGLGQNMLGTGATAASNLGQGAMNYGQGMGELEYGKTNAPGDMFRDFANTAIKAAMAKGGP